MSSLSWSRQQSRRKPSKTRCDASQHVGYSLARLDAIAARYAQMRAYSDWRDSLRAQYADIFIRAVLALLMVAMLPGCSMSRRRDCLVQAVGFTDALKSQQSLQHRWARVLCIYWATRDIGHAVAVFDSEQRGIWARDAGKPSWLLTRDRSLRDYPRALAELYAPNTSVREAVFFE